MAFTSALGKENHYIDLTMDSDDENCCSSIIEFDSSPYKMDIDDIEEFYEEEISDSIEVYNDEQQHFFDEDVSESDLEKGRVYFDEDNGFYQYNTHYSNSDSERYFQHGESFFEKEPETVEEYTDEFFTDEFSIITATTNETNNNDLHLNGSTLCE